MSVLRQLFYTSELRNKIFFVLGALALFRVFANIPIPGINPERLAAFFAGNQFFGLLNLFSGGALSNLSLMMLGLGPYITATIILQLFTMIFPRLKEMYQEEGEMGRQKFNQYSRMLTVPLSLLQGYGLITLFTRQGLIDPLKPLALAAALLTVTAGSLLLMWIGELISEKGIGNGISLLIFAGIIADAPSSIQQLIASGTQEDIPGYIIFAALSVIIVASVVVVNEARRNIPVTYAKRVRGNKMYGGVSTFLPINLNPAGVIPIIFALSILLLPTMIASFAAASTNHLVIRISEYITKFSQGSWEYNLIYFILVVLFTYFYTAVTFEPHNIATNLQKQGGFIPGIRPGNPTSEYLSYILNRTLFVGALFLGTIAVFPSIIQGAVNIQAFRFLVGGTAVLIVVSVVLETVRQIRGQLAMRQYEEF
ncbi:MAG: preprotein translocase subunit SecY [Candidatus Spechtbacteria bacterium]|nr:preprotein translocase subunit SecY [Candidatus Spechtbacteria bacterium]